MKKALGAILILAMLLTLAPAAVATDRTVTASITYRGIRIVANGEELTPADAGGEPVEPFIMGGTTYLPVRAVAGAFGLEVSWDGAQNAVILTSGGESQRPTGKPLATHSEKSVSLRYRNIIIMLDGVALDTVDAAGAPTEPFILDGTTYLPVRAVADALGLDVSWDGATSTVTLDRRMGYYTSRVSREYTVTDYGGVKEHVERRYEYTPDAYLYRTVTDDDGLVYTMTYTIDAYGIVYKVEITGDRTGEEIYDYGKYGSMTVTSSGWVNAVSKEICNEDHVLVQTYYEDYDGGYSCTTSYFYDTNGYLIRMEETWDYGDGGSTDITVYEYDSRGLAVRETLTHADGTKDVTTCTYNDNRQCTLRRTVHADGAVTEERTTYRDYDIASRTVYSGGELVFSLVNEFDANGNVVKATERGDYYTSVTTYEYVSIYATY